ncbi:MAG: hypothetical protein ETSY2_14075 [Candidatus Entotheonella gemina]|uniref:Uncharacterized protein n=1 Tax=Candidatus Entotheonella gemina TaxID=1429439 RepID=W4MBC8_9BACT|nr:MAG: hypothetical protein ETSY2_14075 [Candidatus Entotheonella gemina]
MSRQPTYQTTVDRQLLTHRETTSQEADSAMSRAFVKEDHGDRPESLLERPVSPLPNYAQHGINNNSGRVL